MKVNKYGETRAVNSEKVKLLQVCGLRIYSEFLLICFCRW